MPSTRWRAACRLNSSSRGRRDPDVLDVDHRPIAPRRPGCSWPRSWLRWPCTAGTVTGSWPMTGRCCATLASVVARFDRWRLARSLTARGVAHLLVDLRTRRGSPGCHVRDRGAAHRGHRSRARLHARVAARDRPVGRHRARLGCHPEPHGVVHVGVDAQRPCRRSAADHRAASRGRRSQRPCCRNRDRAARSRPC